MVKAKLGKEIAGQARNDGLKYFSLIIIILLAFFVLQNIFSFIFTDYKFMLAGKGELTQEVFMDGVILHNESVLYSDYAGKLAFEFDNYQRVSVGSLLASIYTGDFDENLHYELSDIKSQLSELEKQVLHNYLEGKSYQEISKEMGKHIKSVDNALQRVKRKLQKFKT